MRLKMWSLVGIAGLIGGASFSTADHDDIDALGMRVGAVTWQSAGAMTFNPEGILFLADSRGARLYAVNLEDTPARRDTSRFQVADLDAKVAAALGTTRSEIRFRDMATHPVTGNIFLSVTRGLGNDAAPALVRVSTAGEVSVVSLDRVRFSEATLPEAPSRDEKTPWGQPKWTLAITDLGFVDGELWVAGLSNEQFASALRRVAFPFNDKASLTTVEIFHTSHNRWETAAPIEAFTALSIDGTPMILAGYGCSPLATFKVAEVKQAQHLKGRTVAELGGGNRPLDIISYENKGKRWILVANSDRTLMRFDPEAIGGAAEMTTAVSQAYQPGGVPYLPIASSGVMQIDDFGTAIVVLQRDIESGAVELGTYRKEWL